jgi:hypothetical protein
MLTVAVKRGLGDGTVIDEQGAPRAVVVVQLESVEG